MHRHHFYLVYVPNDFFNKRLNLYELYVTWIVDDAKDPSNIGRCAVDQMKLDSLELKVVLFEGIAGTVGMVFPSCRSLLVE